MHAVTHFRHLQEARNEECMVECERARACHRDGSSSAGKESGGTLRDADAVALRVARWAVLDRERPVLVVQLQGRRFQCIEQGKSKKEAWQPPPPIQLTVVAAHTIDTIQLTVVAATSHTIDCGGCHFPYN